MSFIEATGVGGLIFGKSRRGKQDEQKSIKKVFLNRVMIFLNIAICL